MTRTGFELVAQDHPRLARMRTIFAEQYRFSRDIVDRAIAAFGGSWADEAEETLRVLFSDDEGLNAAIRGYSVFALDSMRRQARFEKTLAYPSKTYAEAASEVYFNDAHMMGVYLPGLLLSHFLWPHHYRQLEFFDAAFVRPMKAAGGARFVEVGVGTGLYSRRLLQALPAATGYGLDISPSSQEYANRHVAAFGLQDRYQVHLRDVAEEADASAPWLLCVEVLEHLEDPVAFLKLLRRTLAPGGRAFITAALDAANADHIYLYRTSEEVQVHLQAAGFALEQAFLGAAYKPAQAGAPVPLAAAFVVI
ncbi:class I SAM-dependent methyltransferase [Phenylobacterium sp.]|uniref:class I SAM-dependent methyltransferase n=1 Tax=Phenylobacterium sp. TaxID=1871053 RepID=UPI0030F4699B